jgi:hypothetical protein
VLLAITLGNSGKNFRSSGVPSFAERSCTRRSANNFFKKKLKTVFADSLCQVRSAQDFLKKIEKQPLPTAYARGSRHRFFQKNKTPSLFKNRQLNPPLTTNFFSRRPTVGSQHSLCREPQARVLDKEPWPRKNSP